MKNRTRARWMGATLALVLDSTVARGQTVAVPEPGPAAPGPVVWLAGHGYERVDVPTGTDWFEAYRAAMERSRNGLRGHLATVTSPQEDIVVRGLAANGTYWLGGFQPQGSAEPAGGWRWVTGEGWGFADWVPGEPNNAAGNEDGVETVPGRGWNDAPRSTRVQGYVVEYESGVSYLDATESVRVVDTATGHTYQRVDVPAGIDWTTARDEAARHRQGGVAGRLATVTSAAQQTLLQNLTAGQSCWLGAFQPPESPEPTGGWQWLTGEPLSLANWAPGEPNNTNGNEDAVEMYGSGQWNDVARTTPHTCYLMEYPTR